MDVSLTVWVVTLIATLGVVAVDFIIVARRPHEPTMREATLWVSIYIGLAVLFGLGLTYASGGDDGGQFFAGWLTEYSLSVDNLFVFLLIIAKFGVPREYQQRVILIGIALSLVLRGVCIALGAEAIQRFDWVFFIFGAFLVFTAWKLALADDEAEEFREGPVLRAMGRVLPTTDDYQGPKVIARMDGKYVVTPMLFVMTAIAIGNTVFALDSIPAVFGLTQEPYIVFTATVFALMGLRQLYFLIGGLLDRLIYLSYGLAIVLGFIGIKLILEALHHYGVHVPEASTSLSLTVIAGTLACTAVASLLKSERTPEAETVEADVD